MSDFFSKKQFTEEDINLLIKDKIEESNILEYKSAAALIRGGTSKIDISKDISSFANSEGGILIYGIEEEGNVPSALSYIDGNQFSKEWLSQVIESNIKRKIEGLVIHPIRFNNEIEKTVYVIQIPCDMNTPHMAADHRFYRRYNSRSEPMEEYEIRNMYFRKQRTSLKLIKPKVKVTHASSRGNKYLALNFHLDIQTQNIGETIEMNYKVELAIPYLFYLHGQLQYDRFLQDHFSRTENDYSFFIFPNKSPLFQKDIDSIKQIHMTIKAGNIEPIKQNPIFIKLFYSSGVDELELDLNPSLIYEGKELMRDDFSY